MSAAAKIRLRAATADDSRLLFDWVNRPDSLENKLHTRTPIAWEDHEAWMARRLEDPDTAIWIAERGGEPVGQIRLEGGRQGLAVDIYVTRSARKRGVAQAMLAQACALAQERWPNRAAVAKVRFANEASLRLFAAAGFRECARQADHVVLMRGTA